MDYLQLLHNSFAIQQANNPGLVDTRAEFLADSVFGFTTYDSDMAARFAAKAVEVCAAINDGKTMDYCRDADSCHQWYLIMVNMPFFSGRLDWGTSIRGAWWDMSPRTPIQLESLGLWQGDEQCLTLNFPSTDAWRQFIAAVIDFADGK